MCSPPSTTVFRLARPCWLHRRGNTMANRSARWRVLPAASTTLRRDHRCRHVATPLVGRTRVAPSPQLAWRHFGVAWRCEFAGAAMPVLHYTLERLSNSRCHGRACYGRVVAVPSRVSPRHHRLLSRGLLDSALGGVPLYFLEPNPARCWRANSGAGISIAPRVCCSGGGRRRHRTRYRPDHGIAELGDRCPSGIAGPGRDEHAEPERGALNTSIFPARCGPPSPAPAPDPDRRAARLLTPRPPIAVTPVVRRSTARSHHRMTLATRANRSIARQIRLGSHVSITYPYADADAAHESISRFPAGEFVRCHRRTGSGNRPCAAHPTVFVPASRRRASRASHGRTGEHAPHPPRDWPTWSSFYPVSARCACVTYSGVRRARRTSWMQLSIRPSECKRSRRHSTCSVRRVARNLALHAVSGRPPATLAIARAHRPSLRCSSSTIPPSSLDPTAAERCPRRSAVWCTSRVTV